MSCRGTERRRSDVIRWLLVRIVQAFTTLVVVITILFFLMRLAPGDPLPDVGDRPISSAAREHLLRLYGLDQPLGRQFLRFVAAALKGDLGVSFHHRQSVTAVMLDRMPATVLLGGTVLLINFTLGVWLGVRQALRKGGRLDEVLSALSLAGYAIPSFWLGLMLAWWLSVQWHLFPSGGARSLFGGTGIVAAVTDVLWHLTLPAITLSLVSIAATMRYQRSAMLEVLGLDFVRTARAKGLVESAVVWRHAWRNALFPIITLFGLWLPILATGSVFVEAVFAWPGLGSLAAEAIAVRDYPLLMGIGILVSTLIVAGALLADVAYLVLDPRIRLQEGPRRQ